ncbi:chorismate-binding protein [Leptolyngbya ohadii]|uniref:chorismate-binding protein n=1 Tax=Leptolyngbya ohadii TaxID=1962290 RepID=UPI0015C5CC49|nr:chorismate-binding protein [Leptolyngbya ohadii]
MTADIPSSDRFAQPPQVDRFSLTDHSLLLHDADRCQWLLFQQPIAIYTTQAIDRVLPLLQEVEQRVRDESLHAAGMVAYDAAPAFDPTLKAHPSEFPLIWFGLYAQPQGIELPLSQAALPSLNWQPSIDEAEYRSAIGQIKRRIHAGDTYQVNYTFRLRSDFAGDPFQFWLHLIRAQGAGYGAFLQLPDWSICSASPELFFTLNDQKLISRPMKGTIARGLWQERDRQQANELRQSEKNQAENLMIVDMVRNDMGQIAEVGSVSVPGLFDLEQYPTLWQMTSTVQGKTSASIAQIFQAMFPPASITGAPKARTMEIITELETTPRQLYTGTIGWMSPASSYLAEGTETNHSDDVHPLRPPNPPILGGTEPTQSSLLLQENLTFQSPSLVGDLGGCKDFSNSSDRRNSPVPTGIKAQFSVAIRTILIDRLTQTAEYGTGGGIVWDSADTAELQECYTKAQILTQSQPAFDLLETILWTPTNGYFLLDRHLERLQNSAQYFNYRIHRDEIRQALLDLSNRFAQPPQVDRLMAERSSSLQTESTQSGGEYRVRLTVSQSGQWNLTHQPWSPTAHTLKAQLCPFPVEINNPFLYHKTTNRSIYERAKQACPQAETVLLWNDRGEAMEFCIGNLVVEQNGQAFTPPIESGLLAGTYRAELLAAGKIQERVIPIAELVACDRIWLMNSVRKLVAVDLLGLR